VSIESPIESPVISPTIIHSPGGRVHDQPYQGYHYPPKTNYLSRSPWPGTTYWSPCNKIDHPPSWVGTLWGSATRRVQLPPWMPRDHRATAKPLPPDVWLVHLSPSPDTLTQIWNDSHPSILLWSILQLQPPSAPSIWPQMWGRLHVCNGRSRLRRWCWFAVIIDNYQKTNHPQNSLP